MFLWSLRPQCEARFVFDHVSQTIQLRDLPSAERWGLSSNRSFWTLPAAGFGQKAKPQVQVLSFLGAWKMPHIPRVLSCGLILGMAVVRNVHLQATTHKLKR